MSNCKSAFCKRLHFKNTNRAIPEKSFCYKKLFGPLLNGFFSYVHSLKAFGDTRRCIESFKGTSFFKALCSNNIKGKIERYVFLFTLLHDAFCFFEEGIF